MAYIFGFYWRRYYTLLSVLLIDLGFVYTHENILMQSENSIVIKPLSANVALI